MKTLARQLFSALLVLVSFSSFAASESAYQVVSQAGDKLFSRIKAEQAQIKADAATLETIVEQELMPYIDYQYAAYKILGKHLRKTSKEQRKEFVTAMRHYLVRTYAGALKQYKQQKVTFHPPVKVSGKVVAVTAVISDAERPDINIDFKMRLNKKKQEWKAFDMVVEGISLLTTKQAEIAKKIREQGIEKTTAQLAAA